jgi:WD40 repeat protein/serine/threonine protein kinase
MAVAADRNEETTAPNEPAAVGLAAAGIDVLAPSLPPAKPGHGPWSEPPEQIGVYRVLEKIAEGGMGVVYKAEQRGPVRRVVALKLVKPGMYSSEVIARFEAERQALAMMNHPHVARAFDAGVTEDGTPYFVMEYVPGEPITTYCDRERLSTRQRLELFIQACEAVQHAHQKAILHRDIKPNNVLVALDDGQAVVKVIDFGVAKALNQRLSEHTLFTEHGKLIGTPEYMSPEQAEMSPLDVDTRTDIYSLGVLLYELLTGTLPFDPKALRRAAFDELRRIIREDEPPKPSTRLSGLGDQGDRIAKCRSTQFLSLCKEVGGELEWIPLKAMRKDRSDRYRSASELADDIRNYLTCRPLIAGPQSRAYRVRKFVAKHAHAVAAAAALLVVLVGLTIALAYTARTAIKAKREQEAQSDKLKKSLDRETVATTIAEREKSNAEAALRKAETNLARSFLSESDFYRAAGRPAEARAKSLEALKILRQLDLPVTTTLGRLLELRGDATPVMGTVAGKRGPGGFFGHGQNVTAVAVTADGKDAISASDDRTIKRWDVRTGIWRQTLSGHDKPVNFVALSPVAGERRALSGGNDGKIILWDLDTGAQAAWASGHQQVWVVAFSPDGRTALSGGLSEKDTPDIYLWDLGTHTALRKFKGHAGPVAGLAFAPDGRHFLSASHDGTIRYWDIESETPDTARRFEGHGTLTKEKRVNCIVLSPDGQTALSASFDGTLILWDVATGTQIGKPLIGHKREVWRAAFSPDGALAISGGSDGTVRLWNLATHEEVRSYTAGEGKVQGVAFLPDGRGFISTRAPTGSYLIPPDQSALVVWKIDRSDGFLIPADLGSGVKNVAISGEGKTLLLHEDGGVEISDAATGKVVHSVGAGVVVRAAAMSSDGKRVLCAGPRGSLVLWDLARGTGRTLARHDGEIDHVAFLPDGRRALSCGSDGLLWLSDLDTGACRNLGGPGDPFKSLSVSADGKWAYAASVGYNVHRWNLELGDAAQPEFLDKVLADRVAASPDGDRLLYGRDVMGLNVICLILVATGEKVPWMDLESKPSAWAFSPDGHVALVGHENGTVSVWDVENLGAVKRIRSFEGAHPGPVSAVAISSDGNFAVTSSPHGGVRLWDFHRTERLATLEAAVRDARAQLERDATDLAATRVLAGWYAAKERE